MIHQSGDDNVENGKEGTDTRELTRKDSTRFSKCLDLEKSPKSQA